MPIPMDETADILGLVTAYLTLRQALLRALDARGSPRVQASTLAQTLRFEEPADRRVGGHRGELRVLLGEDAQIVMMEHHAPATVLGILRAQRLAYRDAQRCLSAQVGAHLAPQDPHRVAPLLAGSMQPSLDRRHTKAYRQPRDRVLPLARGELFDLAAQLALRRR